ncbi:hypothetical protein ABIB75_007878 [Bradyrhizobium sp. GM2.2]
MVGYRRFEGLEAAKLLAELYRSARLFVNFFQPSFKLVAKQRDGARVRKTYSAPATPHQRLAAPARTTDAVRAHFQEIYALSTRSRCCAISALHRNASRRSRIPSQSPMLLRHRQLIDLFLASLGTAWKDEGMRTDGSAHRESEERPASSRPPHRDTARSTKMVLKLRRGGLVANYSPDRRWNILGLKLLRTLQRRLKSWRSEQANALLFAPTEKTPSTYEVTTP